MLYIGYLIILDCQSISKRSVSEISIFELPRHKQVVPRPSWEPPLHPKTPK